MKATASRPWAVTLIAWFFIVYALLSTIPRLYLLVDADAYQMAVDLNQTLSDSGYLTIPFWFQLAHALAGIPVILVACRFMLKGRLWALLMFLIWVFGALLLTVLTTGLSVLWYAKLVTATAITLLLIRPRTLRFFRHSQTEPTDESTTG